MYDTLRIVVNTMRHQYQQHAAEAGLDMVTGPREARVHNFVRKQDKTQVPGCRNKYSSMLHLRQSFVSRSRGRVPVSARQVDTNQPLYRHTLRGEVVD